MDLSIREKLKDGFPDDDVDLPMCNEEWDMIHQIVFIAFFGVAVLVNFIIYYITGNHIPYYLSDPPVLGGILLVIMLGLLGYSMTLKNKLSNSRNK
jgi:hypothetical protein